MKRLVVILTYDKEHEMLLRHLPYLKKIGDILISSPIDAPSILGGLCFGKSEHHGPHLVERLQLTIKWCANMEYDEFFITEADTLIVGNLPKKTQQGLLTNVLNNHHPNSFKARQYFQPPYWVTKDELQKIANGCDNKGIERGYGDRWLGWVIQSNKLPYSQCSIFADIWNGEKYIVPEIVAIHSVKTKKQFLKYVKNMFKIFL